jgi:hypothetical protein
MAVWSTVSLVLLFISQHMDLVSAAMAVASKIGRRQINPTP